MSTPFEDAQFELLVAEPAVRTEIRIGYARVSTAGRKARCPSGDGGAVLLNRL
ncbi:hypothetical protein [Kitasatospora sp. A2-31]|uniref:hypothetical protein n=1 Tax=Kitasatospora sp. A2-31 TaxID=2916414 RepID=UPI001EEE6C2D|nr:hypothetical protein [Kitasatospora sp. A2-31]MCG6500041.1 hypothetical protein [Kitasatospora sp. A2-31]